MRRIFVEYDYDGLYTKFWRNLGDPVSRQEFRENPGSVDLVCFTGGEDVSPELYNHENLGSGCSMLRDRREMDTFNLAAEYNIPMTGICRGSQFLNVMCGGTMVQDLRRGHGGSPHMAECLDGTILEVTSSHHQMSVLGEGGVLLSWADHRLRPVDLIYDGDIPKNLFDPADPDKILVTEAFCYPERRIFGVQHHPEWQSPDAAAWDWTLNQIRKHCFGEDI